MAFVHDVFARLNGEDISGCAYERSSDETSPRHQFGGHKYTCVHVCVCVCVFVYVCMGGGGGGVYDWQQFYFYPCKNACSEQQNHQGNDHNFFILAE